ncbi:zinc-dependent metalloprotease [Chryseobacterium limigenitum]|uniref:Por secretion system C-terminal sorting domain-containing protein n=1 Tax=Chryseobacterium limigenitum TaxID=1612149 RepID=A0A1K2IG39_9FLAO|nr:zinc-dependent metalloprotease [Chryseobacterium limigenitum]SFZ91240.1 Por secretion system C-terminal sorting domain-containing protein [Chryseobacterium limigenitum]
MKTKLPLVLFAVASSMVSAQWNKTTPAKDVIKKSDNSIYYQLDIDKIRTQLLRAPKYGEGSGITVSIPTLNGKTERFTVNSLPVIDEAMASQYQLGSYVGIGMDDPSKYIRFSVAPNDFQSMMISNGKYEFIEPATQDKSAYSIHGKSSKNGHAFTCSTKESKESVAKLQQMQTSGLASKSNDKKYHTLRLAMSVTGEYTTYFGGTANALAQINATLTRVNGVFEQEFNLHLNMVSAPNLIFTTAASDPYSNASQMCKWNYELMNTLHGGAYGVTDASFDIGHLFGKTGGGGNAGCIGCIGSNDVSTTSYSAANGGCGYAYISPNNYKGSGITSPANGVPMSDTFDIDYVAHELGHQLGDSHTYSFYEDFLNQEVEPGSGSTIMGYAGITGASTDLQDHSDPYFHSVSIDQVQAVLTTSTVDVETPITNNTPVVTAMPTTYTIPRSTAFVLNAVATDPDGDALTYSWEQVDPCILDNGIDNTNIGNETSGAIFRSWPAVTTPTRYFPKLATVLGGNVANVVDFESASNVARTTNFRVTVRDNKPAGQAQTAYATQTIVVGSASAFTVNASTLTPNTNSTITWVVSGTTASPYNVANVKIDYTFDGGATWTVLAASVPNSGTASVLIPASLAGKSGHVRVSAIGNVFYAVKQNNVATLGTSEVGNVKTVQIYPNPVDDILNVKNISSKSTYEIYNAPGQLISKGTIGDGKIVVRDLVKGVYFININDNGTDLKTKFVKK